MRILNPMEVDACSIAKYKQFEAFSGLKNFVLSD